MAQHNKRRNFLEDIMKVRLAGERGMSLVEATIILMVLAIVTAVIAPSLNDYVEDARSVKAKEDVEAIGTAIKRLLRDTGRGCISELPTNAAPCNLANREDVLVSNGNNPTVSATSYDLPGLNVLITDDPINWLGASSAAVSATQYGTMDEQLVTNGVSYTNASFTLGGGPRQGIGWRGAYLTGPIGPDPWGNIYQANTVFFLPASNATAGTGNGQASGGWINDVIVISAGPNGDIQTIFGDGNTGATAPTGDDVLYVVSGSSR